MRHLNREYKLELVDYAESIERDPSDARGHQVLAWLLATCPDPTIRDGRRAVSEATLARELQEWERPAGPRDARRSPRRDR